MRGAHDGQYSAVCVDVGLPPHAWGALAVSPAAEVLAQAGDRDGALALLERLLGMPAGREASVALLRADPARAPLRGDQRFERLLRRFAAR